MRIDVSRLRASLARWLAARRRTQPWAVADLQPQRLSAVRVAPLRHGQRPVVLQAAELDFTDEWPDAEALAGLARELQAGGQRWGLLLPRDDYRVSVVPAPAVPATELAQSLRWQLAGSLDFPVEDAAVDFLRLPAESGATSNEQEIYAVAARGAAVQGLAARFRDARLPLAAIDIRETAQRNIAALLEHSGELLAMAAFGQRDVQFTFSWQGELCMDRLIAEPSCHDESADRRAAAGERIQLQLQRSLDAVRSSYPFMQAVRIVVAGAPDDVLAQLQSGLAEPVEALDVDALFDLSAVPQLREPRSFMRHFHALGMALREREVSA